MSLQIVSNREIGMDRALVVPENQNSTRRMRRIVAGLSAEAWAARLPNGWSVPVTLAHLAFWDQRVLHVIQVAQANGALSAPYLDGQLNDILTPILSAISPEAAGELALRTAEALDSALEACSEDLYTRLLEHNPRFVQRHLHRNHHLDAVELATQSV